MQPFSKQTFSISVGFMVVAMEIDIRDIPYLLGMDVSSFLYLVCVFPEE
jgi:hypothetical protein